MFRVNRQWPLRKEYKDNERKSRPHTKKVMGIKKVTPNREVESDNIYNLMLGKRDYSAMQITTRFSSFTLKG